MQVYYVSIHLISANPPADLHTRNLASAIPTVQDLREEEFLQKLGQPETGKVQRKDGQPLGPGVPRYLVRPTSYPIDVKSSIGSIKIVDFGQSFLSDKCPSVLNTPLPVRAPEIIFKDKVDYRVDLWSMACLVSPAP
jgi:serine/threonine-protein kinase SRPK3